MNETVETTLRRHVFEGKEWFTRTLRGSDVIAWREYLATLPDPKPKGWYASGLAFIVSRAGALSDGGRINVCRETVPVDEIFRGSALRPQAARPAARPVADGLQGFAWHRGNL